MNTNNTTIYDLRKTASAAAEQAINPDNTRKDDLSVDAIRLEAFGAANHDRRDYPQWRGFFDEQVANVIVWKTTHSLSAQQDAAAAKAAEPAS